MPQPLSPMSHGRAFVPRSMTPPCWKMTSTCSSPFCSISSVKLPAFLIRQTTRQESSSMIVRVLGASHSSPHYSNMSALRPRRGAVEDTRPSRVGSLGMGRLVQPQTPTWRLRAPAARGVRADKEDIEHSIEIAPKAPGVVQRVVWSSMVRRPTMRCGREGTWHRGLAGEFREC